MRNPDIDSQAAGIDIHMPNCLQSGESLLLEALTFFTSPIFKIAQTSTMTSLKHKIKADHYEVYGSSNLESSEEDLEFDDPMIWTIVVFHFASSTPSPSASQYSRPTITFTQPYP
jgi:hypothetical protein